MVVAVTGASGQLGQALRHLAGKSDSFKWYFADSSQADITSAQSLEIFFRAVKPDFCINAAAYTAVDRAESEPEKAFEVNVHGAQNLAEACLAHKVKLIHISTDFVFDGQSNRPYREDDTPNPQGVYARTKLEGEEQIRRILPSHFIIRTAWVYSGFGHNFMKTMLRLATERDQVGVVNDQTGSPTHALDLARALIAVINSGKDAFGLYHFTNEGHTTWHGFAARIFELNDCNVKLNAITTADFPTPAKRPKYSVLDKTKFKQVFGFDIRPWQDALANP